MDINRAHAGIYSSSSDLPLDNSKSFDLQTTLTSSQKTAKEAESIIDNGFLKADQVGLIIDYYA